MVEGMAKGLTNAQRDCLLDLSDCRVPWLMGNPAWLDHESRLHFYELGLLQAEFPDARPGDSGLQHWSFNELGQAVAVYFRANGYPRVEPKFAAVPDFRA